MKLLLIDKREAPTVAEQIAAGFTGNGKLIDNATMKMLNATYNTVGYDGLRKFLAENEDIYVVFDQNKQRFWF